MTREIAITLEDDAVPIVRIIGKLLRRQRNSPAFIDAANALRGTFTLASTTDPQHLSITSTPGELYIERGRAQAAMITLNIDFDRMSDPDYKPSVEGFLRHPVFALKVARLMSFPERDWQTEAHEFWQFASTREGMPPGITIRATDTNQTLTLGHAPASVELEGKSGYLGNLLSGGAVLLQEVIKGHIQIKAEMRELVVLTGATVAYLLGEE